MPRRRRSDYEREQPGARLHDPETARSRSGIAQVVQQIPLCVVRRSAVVARLRSAYFRLQTTNDAERARGRSGAVPMPRRHAHLLRRDSTSMPQSKRRGRTAILFASFIAPGEDFFHRDARRDHRDPSPRQANRDGLAALDRIEQFGKLGFGFRCLNLLHFILTGQFDRSKLAQRVLPVHLGLSSGAALDSGSAESLSLARSRKRHYFSRRPALKRPEANARQRNAPSGAMGFEAL